MTVIIVEIDGIPCIVLDDEENNEKPDFKDKSEYYGLKNNKKPDSKDKSEHYRLKNDFTFFQQAKEMKSFKEVMDELKKKFKE